MTMRERLRKISAEQQRAAEYGEVMGMPHDGVLENVHWLNELARRLDEEEKRARDTVATCQYVEEAREARAQLVVLRRLDAEVET